MTAEYKITEDDCREILQKHLQRKNFSVLEFEEQSVEVLGIMAGHSKLKTKCKIEDEVVCNTFFVKRMISPIAIQTQMIEEQGAYEKENFAYETLTTLYEEINYQIDYMPQCYFTVKDTLFVFEDAIETGFKSLKNVFDLLDMDHIKIALATLAKFHAGSIIQEHKKSLLLGGKYKMSDEYSAYFKDSLYRKDEPNYLGNKFYKTSVQSIVALIKIAPFFENNREEILQNYLNAVERLYDLVKPSDKFYNVICHGDLWNSNILFKYDDENNPVKCLLLDFQAIRYTVPAHDFLYFIRFNVGTDKEKCTQLAKHYHECLAHCLKENNIDVNSYMTFDAFMESIDYITPFVIIQSSAFATLSLMNFYNIMNDQKLIAEFLYEDRSELSIKGYRTLEEFRKIIDIHLKDLNNL